MYRHSTDFGQFYGYDSKDSLILLHCYTGKDYAYTRGYKQTDQVFQIFFFKKKRI